MKLKAQSHYDKDKDTRFGDCILLYDDSSLTVYDCGHLRHCEEIQSFLLANPLITQVHIVISHNDSDHTSGVVGLLEWFSDHEEYDVKVYTHQYLKHVNTILDKIDDGRRSREKLKEALLEEFNNIREIIELAEKYGFSRIEALKGTNVGSCTIVGPTKDEFTDVAAQAVDNRVSDRIGDETVMNAASVQLKVDLNGSQEAILCGDASHEYLHNLDDYNIIQLPHHGQYASAEKIFDKLTNPGSKLFLISDNTGSGSTSGGSDSLMESGLIKGKRIKNTKNGVVELPDDLVYRGGGFETQGGVFVKSNQRTGGYGYDIL